MIDYWIGIVLGSIAASIGWLLFLREIVAKGRAIIERKDAVVQAMHAQLRKTEDNLARVERSSNWWQREAVDWRKR